MNYANTTLSLLTLFAAACANEPGNFGDENGTGCLPVERVTLSAAEASLLGFSGNDLLDQVAGSFSGSLVWTDSTSDGNLSISYEGGLVEFQDREWVSDGQASQQIGDCNDVLAVEVSLSLSSDDGRLAEQWTTMLLAETAASAIYGVAPESYTGSLDIASFASSSEGSFSSDIYGSVDASSTSLTIMGQRSVVDGDVASADNFDIASLTALKQ